jgi:hypothetical protein
MVLLSKSPILAEAAIIRPNDEAKVVFLRGRSRTHHALSPP